MHFVELVRNDYGSMNKMCGALDAGKQAAFTRDLVPFMESRSRSRDETLVLPSEARR